MAKKTIILVDPCSSRLNFIDEIIKAGYEPVCIFPFHVYEGTYESMCYKNEVSNIKSICKEKSTVIEAPENLEELYPQLEGMEIIGIINCSDYAAHISDLIAEKVGCPLNPPGTSDNRMEKYKMQMAVKEYGLRYIRTAIIKSEDDVRRFWTENNIQKAVVKPNKSGGLKGLHFCNTPSDALVALYSLKGDTDEIGMKHKDIVLQERIVGVHYFFNTVSVNGTHNIMQTWLVRAGADKDGLYNISYSSIPIYPSGFRSVVKYLFNVLDALDFKNGVAQTEIMIDENGPVLMELNPRMMKFYVRPEIQDKAFTNHNSDVALMALTEPEKVLSEWVHSGTVKAILIRSMISTVEGSRYVKPAETLLTLTKGIVNVVMGIPTEGMVDMKRTTHRDLSPAMVQYFDDDMARHLSVLRNIQILERRYPDLLWDKVMKHEACGFTSDINDIAAEVKGKTVAMLNDIGTLEWKEGKFGSVDDEKKYNCGVIVLGGEYKLDERYLQIKKFCDLIKDGGMLYALPSSYQNMPYGDAGMEALLNLLGCDMLIPASGRDTILKCIVRH